MADSILGDIEINDVFDILPELLSPDSAVDYLIIKDTSADDVYKVKPGLLGTLSPLTTKGDLFGFSTVNARIPVGTNGQVLTADSTQALGLKWATPAASGVTGSGTANIMSKWTSGSALGNSLLSSNTTDVSPTAAGTIGLGTNALPFTKIFIGNAATNNIQITRIASGITAARVASFPDATGTVTLDTGTLFGNGIPIWQNTPNHTLVSSGLTIGGTSPGQILLPITAGAGQIGSGTSPFGHVFLGSADEQNTDLSSAATVPRSVIFPDADGTVGLFTATTFQTDNSVTSGDTRMLVWDVGKNALSRVSVGAADSGGVGFKCLRVPN